MVDDDEKRTSLLVHSYKRLNAINVHRMYFIILIHVMKIMAKLIARVKKVTSIVINELWFWSIIDVRLKRSLFRNHINELFLWNCQIISIFTERDREWQRFTIDDRCAFLWLNGILTAAEVSLEVRQRCRISISLYQNGFSDIHVTVIALYSEYEHPTDFQKVFTTGRFQCVYIVQNSNRNWTIKQTISCDVRGGLSSPWKIFKVCEIRFSMSAKSAKGKRRDSRTSLVLWEQRCPWQWEICRCRFVTATALNLLNLLSFTLDDKEIPTFKFTWHKVSLR